MIRLLFRYIMFKFKLLVKGFSFSMIDDPLVTQILFYPRKTTKPINLPEHIQTLEFEIHDSVIIGGMVFTKDKSLPTVLLFHGNGEIAEDYQYFYKMYHACNLNLVVVDYRGYGFSSGRPYFTSLINDALPIYHEFISWIDINGYSDKIFVMGRSLGSICVSEIGSHNPPNLIGVIFESGFASLYNMMTRLFGYQRKDIDPKTLTIYSNDTKMKKIQKPTLIIHGTLDEIIPYSEGEMIYNSLVNSKDSKFITIEGAGHNNIFSFSREYQDGLRTFIENR